MVTYTIRTRVPADAYPGAQTGAPAVATGAQPRTLPPWTPPWQRPAIGVGGSRAGIDRGLS